MYSRPRMRLDTRTPSPHFRHSRRSSSGHTSGSHSHLETETSRVPSCVIGPRHTTWLEEDYCGVYVMQACEQALGLEDEKVLAIC